jgi:AcrR family transcriptional regulator
MEEALRRTPRQARSQQRVDLILDTAADLFVEVGYESATTNSIAERAGISIGSLYRYFPDKDAILRALAERHLEQVRALYDEAFTEDLVYLPLPVVLDRVIDPIVALHTSCPAYKHILLGSDVSADIAAASGEVDEEIVERMACFLRVAAADLDEQRAHLIALVCKAQVKALLALITSGCGEEFQAQVTAEVKRMLLAYLGPFFGED